MVGVVVVGLGGRGGGRCGFESFKFLVLSVLVVEVEFEHQNLFLLLSRELLLLLLFFRVMGLLFDDPIGVFLVAPGGGASDNFPKSPPLLFSFSLFLRLFLVELLCRFRREFEEVVLEGFDFGVGSGGKREWGWV